MIVERLDDELLVYDSERDEAHCLSALAARVFELCDGSHSPAELAGLAGVSGEEVARVLGELSERDLLAATSGSLRFHSRRDVVRRATIAGAAVAGAAPLIKSIIAPTAALAGSNCTCGTGGGTVTCGANQGCMTFGGQGFCGNCNLFAGQTCPGPTACGCCRGAGNCDFVQLSPGQMC